MTLRCECGGSVEAENVNKGKTMSVVYICQNCGKKGYEVVDENSQNIRGCLVRE